MMNTSTNKQKKVLLIGPILKNLTNFRKELIETLLKGEFEVVLACSSIEDSKDSLPSGVKLVDVSIDRRGKNFIKDLVLIRKYYRLIKEVKPDVVLLFTTKCSVYGGIVCRWQGKRHIINNSGLIDMKTLSWPVSFILKLLYKIGYGGADCLMFQNKYEREYFRKILGNIHYIDIPGSGVNLERYQLKAYPSSDNPIVFNYVARIVQFKGIEEYLECATRIKSNYPNTIFRIYGGYDDSSYKNHIKEMVDKGIIEYGGFLSDMIPAIETCHAVIHPSHYEGLTNVILEHSAMGRVCIASDIPGCKEAITNNVTGFLFKVSNTDDLVRCVEHFIKMPNEDKKTMGRAARKKIVAEFDREIVVSAYMKEIDRIISSK